MNKPSGNIESDPLPQEFDSCEGMRFVIAAELMPQLSQVAAFAANKMTAGQKKPVTFSIQASVDRTRTIKPTLTFEDGTKGMFGVLLLEVETHKKG